MSKCSDRKKIVGLKIHDEPYYGESDLGATLHPCEMCGTVTILMHNLCKECRDDDTLLPPDENLTEKDVESAIESANNHGPYSTEDDK